MVVAVASVALMASAPASALDWVEGSRLSDAALQDAELAASPDGELVAVWAEKDRLVGATLPPGARGFGERFDIAETSGDIEARAVFGPDGRLTVAWLQATSQSSNPTMDGTVRVVVGKPGQRFAAPQTVDTPQRHRGLGLAIGDDGVAYLTYARRAPDANRLDLFVAVRPAFGTAFGAEREVLHQVTSGASRERIAITAARGGATVLHNTARAVRGVDVDTTGALLGVSDAGPFVYPGPSAALLQDGTVAVTNGPVPVNGFVGRDALLRRRVPGAAFGTDERLPGLGPVTLSSAGKRLAALTNANGTDSDQLASVGLPGAFTSRELPVEGATGGTAVIGAPDGRALAAVGTSQGVTATLAPTGQGFEQPERVLPKAADAAAPGVSAGFGRDIAVLAVRTEGDLRTFLRGEHAVAAPASQRGPSQPATSSTPSGGRSTTCKLIGRLTRTLRSGRITVRFRDVGRAVTVGTRPTLRLDVRSGLRELQRVEIVASRQRVRDRLAPFRLKFPAGVTQHTGPARLQVRLVSRSGRSAQVTLRFAVARCLA